MIPTVRNRIGCLAILAGTLLAAGCSSLWSEKRSSDPVPPTGQTAGGPRCTQVRVGGDGFALGDVEQSSVAPQPFAAYVDDLLRAQRTGAAVRYVQRYPDVALSVLCDPAGASVSPPALNLIAQTHDRQCLAGEGVAGWTAIIQHRTRDPQRYAEYDQRRSQYLARLQNGDVPEALALEIAATPPEAPAALLQIDALRLQGIGLLLAERPSEAVRAFQTAWQLAVSTSPYQAANVGLLLSDAQRRAGDSAAADRTWQEAASLAGNLSLAATPVAEPILWERIAYLRPAHVAWPLPIRQQLTERLVRQGLGVPPPQASPPASGAAVGGDEAVLWANIGQWRLARDEPQAALVALKRAESLTADPGFAGVLQLDQAKALIRLGQTPAATAMLVSLASKPDARLAHPAMAMLGTAKLQQGGVQQGFNLLRRAVESDRTLVWPQRAEAEADLGLACLLAGDEAAGAHWLHEAQRSFEAAGQFDALVQCLENEAAFLERAKRNDAARAIRARVDTLRAN